MSMTDQLVLPPDVILLPAVQLPLRARTHIECTEGDYAILRPGVRSYSKIVDAQFAELVAKFREPTTIAEAVISYSLPRQLDPEQTLENAFVLLQQLIDARLLAPANSDVALRIAPSFQPGDSIDGYTIRRSVQTLDDSELYQVESRDGELGALKITRGAARRQQAWAIDRELAILRHLDSRVTPRILDAGDYAGRRYLVTEWLDGKTAMLAAAKIRHSTDVNTRRRLLSLCCAIVDAYARLHAQGVMHGDVHPRNVLVADDGAVRIIDFGLSRVDGGTGDLSFAARGGVSFFFEPEYARAVLNGYPPPPTSAAGEQYSIAALLYSLLTGADYADFSFEQARLLQQVADDAPLPFYKRGMPSWPEVEFVLSKALNKEPSARFATLSELSVALLNASTTACTTGTVAEVAPTSVGLALIEELLQRLGYSNPFFGAGVTGAPSCSTTYGAAGIAYGLYRMSIARQEPRLLSLADLWCQRAKRTRDEPTAFYHPRYDVSPETVGRTSPYHTASGIFCVQALIAHAMGDRATQHAATAAFVAASEAPCSNLDLTLGRSGTLLACSFLLDIAPPPSEAGAFSAVRDLGNRIVQDIWEQIDALGPILHQRRIEYLGIAHGWAGILYATLQWHDLTGTVLSATVPDRLRQLAACAEPSGRGVRWPAILDKPLYMPGWCNGSAGFVHLWASAYQALNEPAYLDLAEQAAWYAWEHTDTLPTLCCGLAGRGYAMLQLYKLSGDKKWLERAEELAVRAAGVIPSNKDLVNSLYKGELGVAVLAADLAQPEASCMPFFEREGWHK